MLRDLRVQRRTGEVWGRAAACLRATRTGRHEGLRAGSVVAKGLPGPEALLFGTH